jgi:hypothetical protein
VVIRPGTNALRKKQRCEVEPVGMKTETAGSFSRLHNPILREGSPHAAGVSSSDFFAIRFDVIILIHEPIPSVR